MYSVCSVICSPYFCLPADRSRFCLFNSFRKALSLRSRSFLFRNVFMFGKRGGEYRIRQQLSFPPLGHRAGGRDMGDGIISQPVVISVLSNRMPLEAHGTISSFSKKIPLSPARFVPHSQPYSQRLILYFPVATIWVTGGPKVLEFYEALAKQRATLLKADGKEILSVKILTSSERQA
jgi:hypothetical protein